MRFLHTSDWHVGKPLRNVKRDEEYAAALAEVLDIARHERVDCLLVAGDLFDSVAPSPESERTVFDFFRELAGARIPAVVVGGNHDHPKRLNAFARILDLVDIHVRGEPATTDEGGVIELASLDRSETAVIAALPWVSERKVRDFESLLRQGKEFQDYAEGVAQMIAHLCGSFRDEAINILLAHVMLDGAIVGGEGAGERPLHLGQTYAVKPQRLPRDAHYVALGHLHRPQEVLSGRGYYAGSLLQLDFGEAAQQKSVNVIEASPGRPAKVQSIALASGRQLRSLGEPGAGLTLDEIRAAAETAGDAYLRVFVRADRPSPGLGDMVRELLPNAVAVNLEAPQSEEQRADPGLMQLSPSELFLRFYRGTHAAEPSEPLLALFQRLYDEVAHEAA